LQQVAEVCRRHDTWLVIIIPPPQIDLQGKVAAPGHTFDEARFKTFAATLETVFDLDYSNAFTADRWNCSVPFHSEKDHEVIQEVWGQTYVRARYAVTSNVRMD
jgi:hypothetical protein